MKEKIKTYRKVIWFVVFAGAVCAAGRLAAMGYTNIIEFGGIIDWPYEIEQ